MKVAIAPGSKEFCLSGRAIKRLKELKSPYMGKVMYKSYIAASR